MAGIDSLWRETKDSYLEYPELPSGDYELQLMAINKFGKQSRVIKVPITVTIQFWKKPWFTISIWVLSLALFWWLAARRLARVRHKQQEKEKLMQKMAELENTALTSQMNPHFIFNCLSAINRIILRNESKIASDYLTRFSRLIRMVLINSQKTMIALEEELQMLRLYLDMERLRFKNSFDYTISFTNAIDAGAVLIPSLLLQPFCENAVWHGLMQKEGQGYLTIELSKRENILHCVITDDGIGRVRAGELKSKTAKMEKSMGLEITAQRLALLNGDNDVTTFFTIEDVTDISGNIAGTRVILKICYKELIEELV